SRRRRRTSGVSVPWARRCVHQTHTLHLADKLLVLENGRISQFGPRTDVVASLTPASNGPQMGAANA
ncbi:hypothetical protein, partial [Brucella intermedia]|uniref:hypothetical protein n=1 Tax=Brucella intermedia TaxID=94625 RepID=UPI003969FBF6